MADLVARPIDAWPERGTLELVDNMELHVGGCAANTGVTLAKLGFNVGLFGKVGQEWSVAIYRAQQSVKTVISGLALSLGLATRPSPRFTYRVLPSKSYIPA